MARIEFYDLSAYRENSCVCPLLWVVTPNVPRVGEIVRHKGAEWVVQSVEWWFDEHVGANVYSNSEPPVAVFVNVLENIA